MLEVRPVSTYTGKTAKAWRRPWQVVRLSDGAVIVVSGHWFEVTAYWHASVRHLFNRNRRVAYDIRRTPEVVGRYARGGVVR